MPGVPSDWPADHRWVSVLDEELASEVTCKKCIQQLIDPERKFGPVYKEPMTSRQGLYLTLGITAFVLSLFIGYQPFKVWSAKLDGEAKFAEAEYSRRVTVLEAQAKLDSAGKLAEAEVARAKGVALANKIVGDSLRGNELYLKYLWIDQLENNKNAVFYIPTEANMPILEAQRLSHLPNQEEPAKSEESYKPGEYAKPTASH
jgi:hypothetical protein